MKTGEFSSKTHFSLFQINARREASGTNTLKLRPTYLSLTAASIFYHSWKRGTRAAQMRTIFLILDMLLFITREYVVAACLLTCDNATILNGFKIPHACAMNLKYLQLYVYTFSLLQFTVPLKVYFVTLKILSRTVYLLQMGKNCTLSS